MIKEAYIRGFLAACARHGIPDNVASGLLKSAAVTTWPSYPTAQSDKLEASRNSSYLFPDKAPLTTGVVPGMQPGDGTIFGTVAALAGIYGIDWLKKKYPNGIAWSDMARSIGDRASRGVRQVKDRISGKLGQPANSSSTKQHGL